ncbi:hypothetical protein ACU8KH_05018 [Lachancea thermotolerans]
MAVIETAALKVPMVKHYQFYKTWRSCSATNFCLSILSGRGWFCHFAGWRSCEEETRQQQSEASTALKQLTSINS